jgi:hypothetical protein
MASMTQWQFWKDDLESARAWEREFFLPMKYVGMVKKDRRTFSLNSAPHTATPSTSQHLTNKAVFNTEAIKYLYTAPLACLGLRCQLVA